MGSGEVAEAETHARWAELGSSTSASPVLSPALPSWCWRFRTLPCRVAAEWALGVRVAMAGYEYVSPEQLAGFDKYKVARAPRTPLSLLGPASPGRLRIRRGPCHLVRRGSGRAGRRFCWGPAESWGFWGWGAWEHRRPADPTQHPPEGIAFSFGDRSARVERENDLRFFTSLLFFFKPPLRGDTAPDRGVLIVFSSVKFLPASRIQLKRQRWPFGR